METSRLPDSLIKFHEKYGVKTVTTTTLHDQAWHIVFETRDGRKVEFWSSIDEIKRFTRKFYHDHDNIIKDRKKLIKVFIRRAYITFARKEELYKLIQSLT